METVYCTQCGQLNGGNQQACIYCDEPLPDFSQPATVYAPPAPPPKPRPYFANDPGGPAFSDLPALPRNNPAPLPPDPYASPGTYPGAPQTPPQIWPQQGGNYPQQYAPPAPQPYGYQGVDAFGLQSYAAYEPQTKIQYTLADRGARLGAALLDGLLAVAMVGGLTFVGYILDQMAGSRDMLQPLFMVLGYLVFFGVYIYYLTTDGASPGKKAVGIRIVKESDLQNGGFVTNFVMRYFLVGVINAFTCGIFSLIDILFIFGQDKKCLHDQMAGTIVIQD
jgi:uncharacterized RDD family membrane protein YckC